MTDDEILATMKDGAALLARYREMMRPVCVALGKQLTEKRGRPYKGHLGGYDMGIETITVEGEDASWDSRDDEGNHASYAWLDAWQDRMKAAGVTEVGLTVLF